MIGGDFESDSIERRFRSAVAKEGLTGAITLFGHLSEEAKQDLLSASKLFVFPSYEEGWSLAVMEAAAYGCVPVVYDLPAYDYLG
ncbi:glycosyl transferase group 1, partial [mine drainage metagenome]